MKRKKFVISLFLATVGAFVFSTVSLAGGQSTSWSAKLTVAQQIPQSASWSAKLTVAQEIPKQAVKNTAASGSFTGTLTGDSLAFTLTFAKLTGPPTMAHFHLGAKGVSGPVLIWLCGAGSPDSQLVAAHPCKSPVTGTVTLTAALQKDFTKGLLYVNVHTAKNPNGEIRGQLAG